MLTGCSLSLFPERAPIRAACAAFDGVKIRSIVAELLESGEVSLNTTSCCKPPIAEGASCANAKCMKSDAAIPDKERITRACPPARPPYHGTIASNAGRRIPIGRASVSNTILSSIAETSEWHRKSPTTRPARSVQSRPMSQAPVSFLERLSARWRDHRTLLCVGLDPDPARLPRPLAGRPDALFEFCRDILDATADLAGAFKPQVAYFAAQRAEDH